MSHFINSSAQISRVSSGNLVPIVDIRSGSRSTNSSSRRFGGGGSHLLCRVRLGVVANLTRDVFFLSDFIYIIV